MSARTVGDLYDEPVVRCHRCGDSGWVVVPHPRAVVGGVMVRGMTLAVACGCPVGVRSRGRVLTLARYEVTNLNWPDQLRAWDENRVYTVAELLTLI